MMPCDLLMAIMQHCASAQLSVMMRTCRTLHRDGVGPRLLLQRDIPINSAKKLGSYIAFIEAGKGARLPLLQSLHFALSPLYISDKLSAAFVKLVPRMGSLECLTLHWHEHRLRPGRSCGRTIVAAFANLTSIKRLIILNGSTETLAVLAHLLSSVTFLKVTRTASASVIPMDDDPIPPTPELPKLLRGTLKVLEDRYASISVRRNPSPFTCVEELIVRCHAPTDFDTRAWTENYPNLKRLDFASNVNLTNLNPVNPRTANLGFAMARRAGWASLEEIRAPLINVYYAGLCSTQVERLVVHAPFRWSSTNSGELSHLPAVIQDVKPTMVDLTVFSENDVQETRMRPVFLHPAWKTVHTLTVKFKFSMKSLRPFAEIALGVLPPPGLKIFNLLIEHIPTFGHTTVSDPWMDADDLAHRFMVKRSTLKEVTVTLYLSTDGGPKQRKSVNLVRPESEDTEHAVVASGTVDI